MSELYLELKDNEWPFKTTDHDRNIVRAIVVDEEGFYYFVSQVRDDDFGCGRCIETSGGGVEKGEELPLLAGVPLALKKNSAQTLML